MKTLFMFPTIAGIPASFSFIPVFLAAVDRLGEALDVNVPAVVDLEKLRSLPDGSLGKVWADFLDQHHITPFTTGPRRKQLHDGVHVLTDYGTDPVGEAEVQAFLLGSKFFLPHLVLLSGLVYMSYRRAILQRSPQQVSHLWNRLWQAYQRGQRSQFDADQWQPELLWELPLTHVQTLFEITNTPGSSSQA